MSRVFLAEEVRLGRKMVRPSAAADERRFSGRNSAQIRDPQCFHHDPRRNRGCVALSRTLVAEKMKAGRLLRSEGNHRGHRRGAFRGHQQRNGADPEEQDRDHREGQQIEGPHTEQHSDQGPFPGT